MFEAEWRNRKAKRFGHPGYVPLYDMNDAEGVLKRFRSCRYGEAIRLSEMCIRDRRNAARKLLPDLFRKGGREKKTRRLPESGRAAVFAAKADPAASQL